MFLRRTAGMTDPTLLPTLVVGILSYNRLDEVLATIDILLRSDYPEDLLHILVLDNDSADGTVETVRRRHGGRVEVVPLAENRGAITRNRAILDRDEPYIAIFDEDCAPEHADTLRRAVLFLERHPDLGGLAFYSINGVTGHAECGDWERIARRRLKDGGFEGVYVTGNGMLFRRDAVQRTSGYDERIFWGSEEFCFALELLYHDVAVAFDPTITLLHRRAPRAIASTGVLEAEARNNIWAPFLHFPLPIAMLTAAAHTGRRLLHAFIRSRPDGAAAVTRGIRQALRGLPDIIATRKRIPVSRLAAHNRWFLDMLVR